MEHNKKVGTLLFLLSFTKCQREKYIERTFFVSAGVQKGENQWVLGLLYHHIYRIQKINFQSNLYLHKVYLSYFQLAKKVK